MAATPHAPQPLATTFDATLLKHSGQLRSGVVGPVTVRLKDAWPASCAVQPSGGLRSNHWAVGPLTLELDVYEPATAVPQHTLQLNAAEVSELLREAAAAALASATPTRTHIAIDAAASALVDVVAGPATAALESPAAAGTLTFGEGGGAGQPAPRRAVDTCWPPQHVGRADMTVDSASIRTQLAIVVSHLARQRRL
jgi:hypothetical protein